MSSMRTLLWASSSLPPRVRSLAAGRHGWICATCSGQLHRHRPFSSSASLSEAQAKPYYVTTPIFYVNASPHVGHLYSMILADTFKRWAALSGQQAILCTGTDEHGMKVQRAAELQESHPKALCDSNSEIFRDLAQRANVANDHFVRTTDPEHMLAVENFWMALRRSGSIYETKHEGWYCVSDETFYPDNLVEKQVSPTTGKIFMASVETGSAVEWTEEKNYHFRLTAFRDKLLQFFKENPEWVTPATRMAEVVDWVENHLEDLSISRPLSRLSWGIPVPDDDSQTVYVWVDALVNYLTKAGYPLWQPGAEEIGGWPADVHVIGKDIVRFHCVYWPALLMAVGIPLPKRIVSHGHWLMNSRKMSKSVGNVVNPFFALDRWGVDTVRYFLLEGGGMARDSEYDNALLIAKYKKDLQGLVGNLLNRVTRAKAWNFRDAVEANHSGQTGHYPEIVENHLQLLRGVRELAVNQMESLDPHKALREIMKFMSESNVFFHQAEAWNLAKAGDTTAVNQVVFAAGESVRIATILLQPFIPEKAAEILDRLGVEPDRRTLQDAELFSDNQYGISRVPLGTGASSSVFPPAPVED